MRFEQLLLTIGFTGLLASSAIASTFTGPTSPYYLDNYYTKTIYVVQGTSVVNSFPWAYGADANGDPYNEGNLAVSSTVNTRPGSSPSGGQGGQYTLNGTPTGLTESHPTPAGVEDETSLDGTSDGLYNYYVQYFGQDSHGNHIENVYQTSLTWQNPTELFSVQTAPGSAYQYLGIAYDPTNQSLWISGNSSGAIKDYSLSGTLLHSFSSGHNQNAALGYDQADNTLWISDGQTNLLEQYSTTGTLLQSGTPTGLPYDWYLAGDFSSGTGVPEPTYIPLLVTMVGAIVLTRRGKSFNA